MEAISLPLSLHTTLSFDVDALVAALCWLRCTTVKSSTEESGFFFECFTSSAVLGFWRLMEFILTTASGVRVGFPHFSCKCTRRKAELLLTLHDVHLSATRAKWQPTCVPHHYGAASEKGCRALVGKREQVSSATPCSEVQQSIFLSLEWKNQISLTLLFLCGLVGVRWPLQSDGHLSIPSIVPVHRHYSLTMERNNFDLTVQQ